MKGYILENLNFPLTLAYLAAIPNLPRSNVTYYLYLIIQKLLLCNYSYKTIIFIPPPPPIKALFSITPKIALSTSSLMLKYCFCKSKNFTAITRPFSKALLQPLVFSYEHQNPQFPSKPLSYPHSK